MRHETPLIYVCGCGVLVFDDADDYRTHNESDNSLHTCSEEVSIQQVLGTKEKTPMGKLITKVERNENKPYRTTQNMQIGQLAEVEQYAMNLGYGSEKPLLLRTYSGFVNLRNPSQTWEKDFEAAADILPDGSVVTLVVASKIDATVDAEVLKFLKLGKKIDAIKAVRTATNLGLKDAKEYVDNFNTKDLANGTISDAPSWSSVRTLDDVPF